MKAFKVKLEKITLNTVICYVIFEKHIFRYNSFYSYLFLYKINNNLDSLEKVCIYLNATTCNMGLLGQVYKLLNIYMHNVPTFVALPLDCTGLPVPQR